MSPRFPSGVGHGARRARLESPRVCYATPGVRIGTTRASRRRQLPTKRCHAARLFGATRAYQPDSSSQPLPRQPRASVLGNCSTFTPARREPQHRLRDPARHSKPLDGWSFHISRRVHEPDNLRMQCGSPSQAIPCGYGTAATTEKLGRCRRGRCLNCLVLEWLHGTSSNGSRTRRRCR